MIDESLVNDSSTIRLTNPMNRQMIRTDVHLAHRSKGARFAPMFFQLNLLIRCLR
jgi:hypothetical protein